MKSIKSLLGVMLMFVISHSFTSCKKDDNIPDEQKTIKNTELITVLKSKGFTIEGNQFLVNGKVRDTKSLDLSGSNLSDVSGLEVFPNLEEVNLSNNKFGQKFDFSQLPETVKRVNLSDNEIYEFNGLAIINGENVTLQKDIEKLILPSSARFNMDLLPYYYKATKGKVNLLIQNAITSHIEPYTTLRDIPSKRLKGYIKRNFPSVMEGGKIDLSAQFSDSESTIDIFYATQNEENLEGIQYIINNPRYKAKEVIILPIAQATISYLKPSKYIQLLNIQNMDTPYLDLSSAEQLRYIWLSHNSSIKALDLSASKRFMKANITEQMKDYTQHGIILNDCPNLEEIKIAEDISFPAIHTIALIDLPKLHDFDMSKIIGLHRFCLSKLPNSKITLPNLQYNKERKEVFLISITKDILNNGKVKSFIMEYGKNNLILPKSWDIITDYERTITPYKLENLYTEN